MASPTKQLKTIRRNKKKKMGRERKRKWRNQGTTPPFAIHSEEEEKKATS